MHFEQTLIQCFIIAARFLTSVCSSMILSATHAVTREERELSALTLTAEDERFWNSCPTSSSGRTAQKILLSLMVNCRASSRGSKSVMLEM